MLKHIHLLPIQEQLAEVNKMIDYFSNYYHVWTNVKQQYAMIEQFKDFKCMIIAEHIEKLRDNKYLKQSPPLYKLLQKWLF